MIVHDHTVLSILAEQKREIRGKVRRPQDFKLPSTTSSFSISRHFFLGQPGPSSTYQGHMQEPPASNDLYVLNTFAILPNTLMVFAKGDEGCPYQCVSGDP